MPGFGQGGGVQNVADWAFQDASLDILFTNQIASRQGIIVPFSPILTVARSSVADYADNSAGIWSSFGANVARLTDKGILIEESRLFGQRNDSMQGAASGTPGTVPNNWVMPATWATGVARTIVGVGTENGVDYMDVRYVGTAASTSSMSWDMEADATIAALSGQSWVVGAFLKLVAGSFANVTSIQLGLYQEDAGGGVNGTQDGSDIKGSITSALTRFSAAFTLTNGTGTTAWMVPRLRFVPVAAAIDFTLRIGWPTPEQGLAVTSPARTTNAAYTRQADVVTRALTASPSAISIFAEAVAPNNSAASVIYELDDGTNNNRIVLFRHTDNSIRLGVVAGGVEQGPITLGTVANSTPFKVAARIAANDLAASLNGGGVVTDASASVPTGLATARYGRDASASYWNSTIRRIAEWEGLGLSNARLQAIAA